MGHTVATLLQASGIPFIAFDTDPERVAQGQAFGHAVVYGEISDPQLLAVAHAERASLAVITIDHSSTALRAVSILRNTYPSLPIIARARDLEASSILLEAGATEAFPEAVEASLRLGATALQMVGAPAEDVDLLIQGVRSRGYELVSEESRGDEPA
ncbi:NAD-binding protein, partial [Pseudomonadota bacterium]